ncbi:uncharacterized protein [Arachis hypogaea]|uniref:uncharacterized protein n=1 Tax=Arachis hypogaea TaxID=3818 RepID=UPI003B226775
MRKKLGDAKGEWTELDPEVLWAYNTTVHSSTGKTPFRLVYRTEAVIPVEVSNPTLRVQLRDDDNNENRRKAELDVIEESREEASLKQRALQQVVQRRYNKKVIPRGFTEGDLVLRKTEEARRQLGHGKLLATWDGPYRVTRAFRKGAYSLQKLSGEPISGTWNVSSSNNISLSEYSSASDGTLFPPHEFFHPHWVFAQEKVLMRPDANYKLPVNILSLT